MHLENSTRPSGYETKVSAKIVFQAVSLGLFVVLGTCGNCRTIYKILRDPRMQVTLNLFIAVMSVCDLAMCLVVMPAAFVSLVCGRWMFGNVGCKIHYISMLYLGQATALCIATVMFERYLTICRRRYPSLSRKCTLWLFVAIFVLPIPFTLTYYRQHLAYFPSTGMCFDTHSKYQLQQKYIILADVLVLKVFPLAVDLFSFWKIFVVLRRLRRRVGPGLLSNEDKLTASAHAHSAGISLAFLLTYFGLCLPLFISLMVNWNSVVNGRSGISGDARAASLWLLWLESVIKPLIYGLRNRRGPSYLRRRFPAVRKNSIRDRLRSRRDPQQIYRCEYAGEPQTEQNFPPKRLSPFVPKLAFGNFTDLEIVAVEPENGSTRSRKPNHSRNSHSSLEEVPNAQDVVMVVENTPETAREGNKLTAALSAIMQQSWRVRDQSDTARNHCANVETVQKIDGVELQIMDLEEFELPSPSHDQVSDRNSPTAGQACGNEKKREETEPLPDEETAL